MTWTPLTPAAARRARSRCRSRGVAAVEFGILLVPLVLMAFGATEFGRAIYTYNTLDKAVRDAVRHLSQHGPGDTTIRAQATALAVCGFTDCAGRTPLAPGLTSSNVRLCDALNCASTHQAQPTGSGSINLVSVAITSYAYSSLVTLVMPSLNFNDISATMRAQL